MRTIRAILFVIAASLAITACQEEQFIKPEVEFVENVETNTTEREDDTTPTP